MPQSVPLPRSAFPARVPAAPETIRAWAESNEACPHRRCAACDRWPSAHLFRSSPTRSLLPLACSPFRGLLPSFGTLVRNIQARLLQNPVALFAFNRPLPVLTHQQSARVLFPPPLQAQAPVTLAYDLVDGFAVVVDVVDPLASECRVGQGIIVCHFE